MMDGREFLVAAQWLAKETDEAALRSAISRAYYAAFNYARRILRNLGFGKVAEGRSHGNVWRYFENCGEKEIAEAGRMLADLESSRVGADYRLDEAKFGSPKNGQMNLTQAQNVISRLERCEETEVAAVVAKGMMAYDQSLSPGA